VPEESPRDELNGERKPSSVSTPKSQLGAGARGGLARRVRALRDSGPGSGSGGAWLRRLRNRASERWREVEATNRHRIVAGLILAAVVLVVWLVLIPIAPCGFPGGDRCAPDDDAIALVPGDALAYVHLDVDPESDQFAAATEIGRRLPLLSRLAVSGLANVAGTSVDYAKQVEPWSGGEVALVALPAGTTGQRVLMVEADDEGAADEFAAELLGPKQSTESAGGTDVSIGPRDTAWAIEDGFLLLGSRLGLTRMLGDDGPSLADAAPPVLDELPDERLAYGYVSPDGARALFGPGGAGPIDTFIDAAATTGAAASLSADDVGLSLAIRSDLDPDRSDASPGFFAALPAFTPSLDERIGPATLAYLGLGDPGEGLGSLLAQARTSSPGLVAAFRRESRRLGEQAGIDIDRDLLPLLGSEAALSLQPVAVNGDTPVPGVTPDAGTPYVSLLAAGADPTEARRSLERLERPVAKALGEKQDGKAATFTTIQVAGLQAHSLAVSDAVDLTWATWDDLLAITTNSLGIAQPRSQGSGLDEAEKYRAVTEDFPDSVSLIAYLDLTGLLNLGEQAGLATDPTYATYAPDLRTLTAAALGVAGGDERIATDLRIAVGPREAPEIDASPLGGE